MARAIGLFNTSIKIGDFTNRIAKQTNQYLNKLSFGKTYDVVSGDRTDTPNEDSYELILNELFSGEYREYDRFAVSEKNWLIYRSDGRIRMQVKGIGIDCTCSDHKSRPYRIKHVLYEDPPPRVEKGYNLVLAMDRRLKLRMTYPQVVTRLMLEGDTYWEPIVDWKTRKIIDFCEIEGAKEGYSIQKLVDEKNPRICLGYRQCVGATDRVVREFFPWQVVEFNFDKFVHYSISLLGPANIDILSLIDLEKDMRVARKERAYMKLAHIYDGLTIEQLKKVARKIQESKIKSSSGVGTDIVTNKDVKVIEGNNRQLSAIPDLEFHRDKVYTSLGRPRSMSAGDATKLDRAIAQVQESPYERFINNIRTTLDNGFEQLKELELLLNGILPETIQTETIWSNVKQETILNRASSLAIARKSFDLSKETGLYEMGFDARSEVYLSGKEAIDISVQHAIELQNNMPNNEDSNADNPSNPKKDKVQRNGNYNGNKTVSKRRESDLTETIIKRQLILNGKK